MRLGVDHTWGGWLEDRSHLWRGQYLPHGCSIHSGTDLNAPFGITVLTPLSGQVVHAVPCREQGGGWGGWFVLRADTPHRGADYLLFGHMAQQALPGYPRLHLQSLSAAAWAAVQRDPDSLLVGYAFPAVDLGRQFADPAPLVGLPRDETAEDGR
jgi:hypothetical protein